MSAIVFGSPEARAIAEQLRAAEALERRLENPLPHPLTLLQRQEEQRDRENEQQRLAAWNRWAQGKGAEA